jgi:GT2 family glycosyltransferase
MKLDVTIGLAAQDSPHALERALDGLYRNTRYPFHLCLIDPNHSHHLSGILKKYKEAKRITVEDRGTPSGWNRLLEQTDTPYLVFLESHTYVTAGWLTMLMRGLKSRPEYGVAGPSTCLAWNEQKIVDDSGWSIEKIEAFGKKTRRRYGNQIERLDRLHSVSDFCYALKREVADKIGGFDEEYGRGALLRDRF